MKKIYIHIYPLSILLLDNRNELDMTIYFTYSNVSINITTDLIIQNISQALRNE